MGYAERNLAAQGHLREFVTPIDQEKCAWHTFCN
jgi:hypothetical protein